MAAEPELRRTAAGHDPAGLDELRPPPAEGMGGVGPDVGSRPLYPDFDAARVRDAMKAVVRERGMTLQQVGLALGAADEKAAVNAAFYLLNHARSPSLGDVVRFSNLTGVPLDRLVRFFGGAVARADRANAAGETAHSRRCSDRADDAPRWRAKLPSRARHPLPRGPHSARGLRIRRPGDGGGGRPVDSRGAMPVRIGVRTPQRGRGQEWGSGLVELRRRPELRGRSDPCDDDDEAAEEGL